jgi:hypothetical protein
MAKKGNRKYEKCQFIDAVIRKSSCKAGKPSDCFKNPPPSKYWVTASCWKRKIPKKDQSQEEKPDGS